MAIRTLVMKHAAFSNQKIQRSSDRSHALDPGGHGFESRWTHFFVLFLFCIVFSACFRSFSICALRFFCWFIASNCAFAEGTNVHHDRRSSGVYEVTRPFQYNWHVRMQCEVETNTERERE